MIKFIIQLVIYLKLIHYDWIFFLSWVLFKYNLVRRSICIVNLSFFFSLLFIITVVVLKLIGLQPRQTCCYSLTTMHIRLYNVLLHCMYFQSRLSFWVAFPMEIESLRLFPKLAMGHVSRLLLVQPVSTVKPCWPEKNPTNLRPTLQKSHHI